MGLSMYLSKKTYVKNWDHDPIEKHNNIVITRGGEIREDIKPERISYIIEEVGFWRKFNALHGWFVNECGGGKDECQVIHVDTYDLKKLLELLNEVSTLLKNSKKVVKVLQDWKGNDYNVEVYENEDEIENLIPPTPGSFFGSTQVDEWFKKDVEETITLLEDLLSEDNYDCSYYYQASW
jgi:hypothetical protein